MLKHSRAITMQVNIDPMLIDVPQDVASHAGNTYLPETFLKLKQAVKTKGKLSIPLMVKALSSGRYELIQGYYRHRAAIELGLKEVPVIVAST